MINVLKIVVACFVFCTGIYAHEGHNHQHPSTTTTTTQNNGQTTNHDNTLNNSQDHSTHDHSTHSHQGHDLAAHTDCGHDSHSEFKADETAFHHISDLNVYSIGPWNFPLPCILYSKDQGWSFFSSSKFDIDNHHHGSGNKAVDRYALNMGRVMRIIDASFPMGEVSVQGFTTAETEVDGKKKEINYVCANGQKYELEKTSSVDGGLFGGGFTSFYDFSITKNVFAMLLVIGFMSILFLGMASAYRRKPSTAPTGSQKLFEPIILFLQDEVAKPFIGAKYERFMPLLLAIFFFILSLNLFGQIPFFGGANVTGNLAVTMVLAIIVFIVVNLNGNKHYWEHILWMPGIPAWVKTLITPIEILGVFIKPVTLMLRLFANITAGHIVIIIFISLIFIFGKAGAEPGAAYGASVASVLLALFISAIELLVAFIQAYVFTLLTASYIGAATEEHHHPEKNHH
ncbi:MAG: F0F1 ATP synthase subunit A [Saprospiraceae bacterium]|nr:F0F1 ATP synthase subunit A [Saprospiraceae bacterium]